MLSALSRGIVEGIDRSSSIGASDWRDSHWPMTGQSVHQASHTAYRAKCFSQLFPFNPNFPFTVRLRKSREMSLNGLLQEYDIFF